MIRPCECKEDETPQVAVIQINPAMKRHWESEIKVLRDAPRNADKLREILKVKQKEYEKAMDREDIERLVPEIEMLKLVLAAVCRTIT
jgi:PleD family two-component response regulator